MLNFLYVVFAPYSLIAASLTYRGKQDASHEINWNSSDCQVPWDLFTAALATPKNLRQPK